MSVTIGRIHPADAWIVAAFSKALQEEEGWPPVRFTPEELLERCAGELANPRQFFWAAWSEEPIVEPVAKGPPFDAVLASNGVFQPVGMLGIELLSAALLGDYIDCGRFYVLPEWRHKGIGRKLLSAAVRTIPEEVDLPILIATIDKVGNSSRPSYRRLGFKPVCTVHTVQISDLRKKFREKP